MNETSQKTKPKVFAIVGATASGKTAYAIELAKKINGEIISADSRYVYKGFNIGTAKPTIEEQDGIIHHLIDIVEPEFEYSAGLYKKDASKKINEVIAKGKIPIVVGGTGLYIDILLKNFDLPQIEANHQLRNTLKELSTEELYEILNNLDPEAKEQINQNDRKKIIRAIEILKEIKRPLKQCRGISQSEYDVEWIGKNFDREILYKRIDDRVDIMIEQGLIEETKHLLNKHGRIPNLINTIGYREILTYIDGISTLDESLELLKKNTRNYAKRQLTWFRRNEDIKWDIFPKKLKK
ncbi:MAG: tRNA (adenosine(37)-N6)-dimethylallyltransferase MiaA [Cyanobacteria bacterium SIG26]|nr:tRNA (adenosine(37)-N6)-dimethylallyltransferase MiaA [Cyanobacteria bacterium SIG26]